MKCACQDAGALLAAPSYAEAHNNLGVLQRDVGAVPDALASYARCLELSPDSRNAGATPFSGALALMWLLRRRSFSGGYYTEVMLVCRSAPDSGSRSATGQNRLLALNYIHQGEERLVCAAHEEWGLDFQRQFKPLPPLPPPPRRGSSAASRPAVAEAAAAGGSAGPEAASGVRMQDDRASHMEALTGGDANHRQENGATGNSVSSISSSGDEADVDSKPLVVGYLSPDLFTVRAFTSMVNAVQQPLAARDSCTYSRVPRWLLLQTHVVTSTSASDSSCTKVVVYDGGHDTNVVVLCAVQHSVSYFAEAPLRHHNQSAVHHIVYNCVAKASNRRLCPARLSCKRICATQNALATGCTAVQECRQDRSKWARCQGGTQTVKSTCSLLCRATGKRRCCGARRRQPEGSGPTWRTCQRRSSRRWCVATGCRFWWS